MKILLSIIVLSAFVGAGFFGGSYYAKREAVKHNAAYYNPKSGVIEWGNYDAVRMEGFILKGSSK